jgi:hypothetical protein
MDVSLKQESGNEWGDEQMRSRNSGLPRRLYLNPCQTVSSDEVQYTNPFRNTSRLKLFFF